MGCAGSTNRFIRLQHDNGGKRRLRIAIGQFGPAASVFLVVKGGHEAVETPMVMNALVASHRLYGLISLEQLFEKLLARGAADRPDNQKIVFLIDQEDETEQGVGTHKAII